VACTGTFSPIVAVVYSPDGQQLVSASMDQRIKVWDVKTGECLRKLEGHIPNGSILTFTFLPGDDPPPVKLVASSSGDRTILLGREGCIKLIRSDLPTKG